MININTNTNIAIFQNKEFEIISKKINDFESVNIELKDRGILYFLNSDITIDDKKFYKEFFYYKKTKEELNKEQYEELEPTDWYFIRYIETGEEIPKEIKEERTNIREKYYKLKINNL